MQPTPTSSFFRFLLGFLVFIAIFFGVTLGVSKLSSNQNPQQSASAAEAEMLK
jgi:hypothetical protein